MKHIAVLLAGCLVIGPAPAIQSDGKVFILDEEEQAKCIAQGGCGLMSAAKLRELLDEIRQTRAQIICGNRA